MGADDKPFWRSGLGANKVHVRLYSRNGEENLLELSDPNKIGQGAFGKTFATFVRLQDEAGKGERPNFLRYAIKVCEDDNPIERDILLKLQHTNIISLYWHNIINDQMYMVLELMDSQDLYELVLKAEQEHKDLGIYVKLYSYQMFRGLAYCDSVNVIHRDIKSENLLINHNVGILKIADFGCGAIFDDKRKFTPYVGTREFRAPEQLMGSEHYTSKIDVWSAAIVLCEMILHHPLFTAKHNSAELLDKIMTYLGNPSDEELFRKAKPDDASNLFVLLEEVLVYSPKQRAGAWIVMSQEFYDRLKDPDLRLPNGAAIPPLWNFTPSELSHMPEQAKSKLLSCDPTS